MFSLLSFSVGETPYWLGLNPYFWISMGAVLFIVILMNGIFWSVKPLDVKKKH